MDSRESKVIAIVNQKGGVGKTTTCVNLAAALVQLGRKVLIIDADAQGSTSYHLGVRENTRVTLTQMLQCIIMDMEFDPHEAIISHEEGMDIVVGNKLLVSIESSLYALQDRDYLLKKYVDMIRDEYDYIVIDSGPALSAWTMNIMAASTGVIIPVQPQPLAADGLIQVINTISTVQRRINTDLRVEGILFTMNNDTKENAKITKEEIAYAFGGVRIFDTMISNCEYLSKAVRYGCSVYSYRSKSNGAKRYMELAEEIIRYNE